MKKLIVLFVLCMFIFTAGMYKTEFDFGKYGDVDVQIFASDMSNNLQLNNCSTVKNGEGEVIFCDYFQYQKIKSKLTNVSGVTFVINGNLNAYQKLINDLKIRFLEKNTDNFIGFSNNFDFCVNVQNKKVNVQGCFSGIKIYIGTPLLLGCY